MQVNCNIKSHSTVPFSCNFSSLATKCSHPLTPPTDKKRSLQYGHPKSSHRHMVKSNSFLHHGWKKWLNFWKAKQWPETVSLKPVQCVILYEDVPLDNYCSELVHIWRKFSRICDALGY